jgi:hypothetical protein
MCGEMLSNAGVNCRVAGLPGGETVDIAVVHAESGGNEDGVMNLKIGRAV